MQFHMAIAAAGQNPYFSSFYERLLNQGRRMLHLHFEFLERGHGGYRGEGGESHFHLSIESAAFAGLGRVQRQRLVYQALGELMQSQVHALAMETKAPGE